MPHPIHIRWGMKRDIPAILACGTSWSEADFLTALRYRNCISMCAERGDATIGFMVYKLHRHHIDVLNFAVHLDHRRQGFGSALFAKLVYKVCSHRCAAITATVPDAALDMQMFLASRHCRALRCTPGGIQFIYRPTTEERSQLGYHFVASEDRF